MTTNSTMTELERRVGFAIWGVIRASDKVCLEVARAALKAHAEWLDSNELEIRAKPPFNFTVNLLEEIGRAESETGPNGPEHRKNP